MKLSGLVLFASLWPGLAAAAGLPADAKRACQRLVAAAQARQLAGAGKCGQYVCERQQQASARFVFALRWRGEGLPAVGSNLIGYYRVDAASGDIHDWDLGEDQAGQALPAVPKVNSLRSSSGACADSCASQCQHPTSPRKDRTP